MNKGEVGWGNISVIKFFCWGGLNVFQWDR